MYGLVEAFIGRPRSKAVLIKRADELHATGQRVPGFDHPLYPKGDPRATVLLDIARSYSPDSGELRALFGFLDEMRCGRAMLPRQEFAIVVLARVLGLPREAAAALFVVGRTAGWVAHVQEQRASGTLLRPRAQFIAP